MDVAGGLARYNADLRALKGDVQAGASSPDRVRSGLMQAWAAASFRQHGQEFHAALRSVPRRQRRIVEQRCPAQLSRKVRRFHFGPGGGQSVCRKPAAATSARARARRFWKKFAGHALDPSAHCRRRRRRKLPPCMRARQPIRAVLRGEYIAAAFEHNVAISTLLEASLRGIPTDQLEMKAGSDTLKSAKVLGHGAANTVTLCVYRSGERRRRAFGVQAGNGRAAGLSRSHRVPARLPGRGRASCRSTWRPAAAPMPQVAATPWPAPA